MTKQKRCTGDSGAALVEAAIVTPVFFILLLAILEFSFLLLDRLTVANTGTEAARSGSVEGNKSKADYFVLNTVKKASSAMDLKKINYVVVYRATGPTSTVPTACKTASSAILKCNRYTGSDMALPDTKFGCGVGTLDLSWCPATRKTALTGVNGPPDFVGIYVNATHPMITGLFGRSYELTSDSVIQIEPSAVG